MRRFLPLALLAACSTQPSGTIDLLVDPDQQTLTKSPAPTTLAVDAIDTSGNDQSLAKVSLPATSVDLGTVSQDGTGVLRVQALDANGGVIASGTSLFVQFGALDGNTLDVFVQRRGEMAHLPNALAAARSAPLVLGVSARYVLVVGGDDATVAAQTAIYDLASYTPLASPPKLPRAPKTIASLGTIVLAIDDAGATWSDLSNNVSQEATAPSGGVFGDVSGGTAVVATDGTVYVVGATRATGAATTRVLAISTSGTLSWANLTVPRAGATATWVEGKGLVVIGGSATGAGVEVLAEGSATASALSFPSDATIGAGATALDATHVLVAGGTNAAPSTLDGGVDASALDGGGALDGGATDAGVPSPSLGVGATIRSIDLACASGCAPVVWQATLPAALSPAQAFTVDSTNVVIAGDDPSGKTHLVRASTLVASDLALRDVRSHARAVLLPTGTVALVGGVATIETYLP